MRLSGLSPVATVPKFKLAGVTASWAGVRPEPVTVLVELPPLLVKATRLEKLPAAPGAKVMATVPVWPGAKFKELPLAMAKGRVAVIVPVKVSPPVLTTWKF